VLASRISDLFRVRARFLRSTHLERDFDDPDALRGYVLTPTARAGMERLTRGLAPKSTQRAWRITGDYGTGKSSFALALAHVLAGGQTPAQLRQAVDFRDLGVHRPELLPVLATCSRGPIAPTLLRAMAASLEQVSQRGRKPEIIDRLRTVAESEKQGQADAQLAKLLTEAAEYVQESGKGNGLLVILDELGKFLEYASLHPDRQDIFCLQELAEAAARSGKSPVIVVGLLHQGFHAYAEQLSLAAQKEWEKIAGRYDEFLFDQPLEQTTMLVADALGVQVDRLPRGTVGVLERDTRRAVELGWFGPAAPRTALTKVAPRLYPLHPTTIPVMVRLFSRFGQNERSLYGFLLSDEPHALQGFAAQKPSLDRFYRIHNLYDYARAAFGHRLVLQSYRSHWNQIESVVESFPADMEFELAILKTVAVLNLLNAPDLIATDETITLTVAGASSEGAPRVKAALKRLQQKKSVLYFRGVAGGYCLWPHTSVNLEQAYQEALKAVPIPMRVAPLIRDRLETRPLVARRHYIETGNLRHFRVDFVPPGDLSIALGREDGADGRVIVALCESAADREEAIRFARSSHLIERREVLVAIPQPLSGLSNLVAEVQRWEWIEKNVPELTHDTYAQEEVARQLAGCRQVLAKRVQSYVGLRQFGETLGLDWYHRGKPAKLPSGRGLLDKLSKISDEVYEQAPKIANELVNRHSLSSAAAAARQRLIERLLKAPSEALLGMDAESKPPEMSMYLSVLKAARLHRETNDGWAVILPPENDDPCQVRPVLIRMRERLDAAGGARVPVLDLFAELQRPPYGLREGLNPLLLAVFAVLHEQDVAFYEGGGFVKQVTGQEFQRLVKSPEKFSLQYCRVAGVRAAVFERLYKVLHPDRKKPEGAAILDVVRPLCVFAAQLPDFVRKTSSLSQTAIAVREHLLRAEEPATLLFRHLPEACGGEPFEGDDTPNPSRVRKFVDRLHDALDELRICYPELLGRMKAEFVSAFERPGGFEGVRETVASSAREMIVAVSEPQLKAFCLRLTDLALPEVEWLESLGSLLCSKPSSKWLDRDESAYREELARLVRLFRRVESTAFGGAAGGASRAMRVAITCQDGTEVEQVVYLDAAEESRVAELEFAISRLVRGEGRLGVLAATRAIWGQLAQGDVEKK
jgi:hypothetical protein